MKFWKNISKIIFGIFLMIVVFGSMNKKTSISLREVNAADVGSSSNETCLTTRVSINATNTMEVPSVCINGLCKLILYTNASIGSYGPGYSWEVYYAQYPATNDEWQGGPNIEIMGLGFSDGHGWNGNGISEGVFLGGTTADGGYIRIMDDGPLENDPNLWTIESQSSPSLTSVSLHACSLDYERSDSVTGDDVIAVDVPEFCMDTICMILRWTPSGFGNFGPGFSMPVYYEQSSTTDEWIGGPDIDIAGISFSGGSGVNGDSTITPIFNGGVTDGGGYARLLDDHKESSDAQWSIQFHFDTDDLFIAQFYFIPMECTRGNFVTSPGVDINQSMNTRTVCLDKLCTIVRWTNAQFSVWGPGLSWPVNYKQNSIGNTWISGPAICLGGQCFTDGKGKNGDKINSKIFDSGLTVPGGGSLILRDDFFPLGETESDQWNVVLDAEDELTAATYYFCENSCQETIFLINKQFVPFIEH